MGAVRPAAWWRALSAVPRRVLLGRRDEIADGAARGFDPDGAGRDTLFVVAKGGALYGYRNACPHMAGAPMAWRKHAYLNGDGSRIVCFAHGAQFRPEDGRCVLGPCLGQSLQPVTLEIDKMTGELFAWI